MSRPQVLSLYRRLLRELPIPFTSHPTRTAHQKLSSPSQLQQRLRATVTQQLKSQSQTTPQSRPKSQILQAEQFTQYVQAQRTYLSLVERYNPGMGMSEEERVRLSARRVGMDLPVEFEGGKE